MPIQIINARSIHNSSIVQVAGDYKPVFRIGHTAVDKPIYFSYADSDVQALYCGTGNGHRVADYAVAMEKALRLLLAFKPFSNPIMLSASSVIQSRITLDLVTKYMLVFDTQPPQLHVLRRESDWADYFAKRTENTHQLLHLERYKGYFDDHVRAVVGTIPATRKSVYSGRTCSELWLASLDRVLPPRLGNMTTVLSDLRTETEKILESSIFVWEAVQPAMKRVGIKLTAWNKPL